MPCDKEDIEAECWNTGSWQSVSSKTGSKRAATHSRQKIWPQAIACGLLLDISATNSQRQTSQRLSECRTSIAAPGKQAGVRRKWPVVTTHNEEEEERSANYLVHGAATASSRVSLEAVALMCLIWNNSNRASFTGGMEINKMISRLYQKLKRCSWILVVVSIGVVEYVERWRQILAKRSFRISDKISTAILSTNYPPNFQRSSVSIAKSCCVFCGFPRRNNGKMICAIRRLAHGAELRGFGRAHF